MRTGLFGTQGRREARIIDGIVVFGEDLDGRVGSNDGDESLQDERHGERRQDADGVQPNGRHVQSKSNVEPFFYQRRVDLFQNSRVT